MGLVDLGQTNRSKTCGDGPSLKILASSCFGLHSLYQVLAFRKEMQQFDYFGLVTGHTAPIKGSGGGETHSSQS